MRPGEERKGEILLAEREPRVFKYFMGWVYFQRIALNQEDGHDGMEHSIVSGGTFSRPTNQAIVSGHQVGAGVSTGEWEPIRSKEDMTTGRESGMAEPQSQTGDIAVDPRRPSVSAPRSTSEAEEAFACFWRSTPKIAGSDARRLRDKPTTWHWRSFFDLYIFTESASARSFRMGVFTVIQLKFRSPAPDTLPRPGDTKHVVMRVAPTSPPFRFLADINGTYTSLEAKYFPRSLESQDAFFAQFPADFLAACLMSSNGTTRRERVSSVEPKSPTAS